MMVLKAKGFQAFTTVNRYIIKFSTYWGITDGNKHNENHMVVVKEFEQNMKFIIKESNGTFNVSANSISLQKMAINLCGMVE